MAYSYLESLIQKGMDSFSDTEEKIANHFLKLNESVINKTLSVLSKEIGVSEASIFKFVKKIGFDGFQQFKISVATNTNSENKRKELTVFSDITNDDPSEVMAYKIIQKNIELLSDLSTYLKKEELNKALHLIYSARCLHFLGQGGSSVLAFDAYHKFLRSKYHCNYIFDYHLQMSYATKLREDDVVVLFSHSGKSKETIEVARILRERNVKIISLTGNPYSELLKLSDVCFVVYTEESAFHSETLTSRLLYLTIIDILYVDVMYHEEDVNKKSIEHIREALSITKSGDTNK